MTPTNKQTFARGTWTWLLMYCSKAATSVLEVRRAFWSEATVTCQDPAFGTSTKDSKTSSKFGMPSRFLIQRNTSFSNSDIKASEDLILETSSFVFLGDGLLSSGYLSRVKHHHSWSATMLRKGKISLARRLGTLWLRSFVTITEGASKESIVTWNHPLRKLNCQDCSWAKLLWTDRSK